VNFFTRSFKRRRQERLTRAQEDADTRLELLWRQRVASNRKERRRILKQRYVFPTTAS
jgi:hypothetical protein